MARSHENSNLGLWSGKSGGSQCVSSQPYRSTKLLMGSSVVAGDGKSDSYSKSGIVARLPSSGEVSAELDGVGRPLFCPFDDLLV